MSMQALGGAVTYFLTFKPYVLLPVIIFVLSLVFRMPVATALRAALTIGIGFIGIFIVFDYFVSIIHPVIEALVARTGLHFSVLDTGWPPLSAITWSFQLAPLLVVLFIAINVLLLSLRLTRTVNIDIWNYWHVILASAMVYQATGSLVGSVVAGVGTFVMVLKLAEWSAPAVRAFSGLSGICIPHLSGIIYFPLAVVANLALDRIPGVRSIEVSPEKMRLRLRIAGEPSVLGFILGAALGVAGGYGVKRTGELAFGFAAVIYILPMMCGILGGALVPVSEGMKAFIQRRFPEMGEMYIGLDVAVLFGIPSVVVTALLLIPISLLLAFILPGVRVIPLGDLTNLVVPVAFIALASRGNVFRSVLIGVPLVAGNLYFASHLAELFAAMAKAVNYHVSGYDGLFTSFLDGGNLYRGWLWALSTGNALAVLFLPVLLGLLFVTWRVTHRKAGAPPDVGSPIQ
jgi:PTS system galactitol-specific IIC component